MKCDQYWPSRGTETYGMIQVTLLDTVELATYTVRTFALYKVWHWQGLQGAAQPQAQPEAEAGAQTSLVFGNPQGQRRQQCVTAAQTGFAALGTHSHPRKASGPWPLPS